MTISELKVHFREALSEIYSTSEIEELFSIFAEHFLNFNKIELRHNLGNDLSESDFKKFLEAISELKTGKPFQQILGETEFYGMKFLVNEHVLIPRPETEELLELAIGKIQDSRLKIQDLRFKIQGLKIFDSAQTDNAETERLREPQPDNFKNLKISKSQTLKPSNSQTLKFSNSKTLKPSNSQTLKPSNSQTLQLFNSPIKILDIGTGSGIIPIVLKKHFPEAKVFALDISLDALEIAKRNAKWHGVEINFIYKDYLNQNLDGMYDIIISNPPYIGIDENLEIEASVKGFEPNLALFSPTSDGLIFYKKIAEDCKKHLTENGLLFLEINQKLGRETLELYKNDFSEAELLKDISGNDRLIFARK